MTYRKNIICTSHLKPVLLRGCIRVRIVGLRYQAVAAELSTLAQGKKLCFYYVNTKSRQGNIGKFLTLEWSCTGALTKLSP